MYDDGQMINPVTGAQGMTTEHAAAALVIASLVVLIAIRRGWSGVSVGGVGVTVR